MRRRLLITMFFATFFATAASGQWKLPPEPKNAALLYWQAFAQLQDYPTDKATAELLEKEISGELLAWDETKFGPLIDDNIPAIEIMQRGTKLPECDWGLEFSLASSNSFPIPFWRNSSRALGRLNTLYGMRLAARDDSQGAVDTWLAGIRFSQQLAHGGTLIFQYTAEQSLLFNLRSLMESTRNQKLTQAEKDKVRAAIRALPDTVFDWGEAWVLEGVSLENGFREVWRSPDPKKAFESFTGEPMPEAQLPPGHVILSPDGKALSPGTNVPPTKGFVFPLSPKDFEVFEDYMSRVQAALTASPEVARSRIEALETERMKVAPLFQKFIPSPSRVNDSRAEIAAARKKLLQALEAHSK